MMMMMMMMVRLEGSRDRWGRNSWKKLKIGGIPCPHDTPLNISLNK
jgi:hypothetical protein